MKAPLLLLTTLALTACENTPTATEQNSLIASGKQVFTENCQICHGVNAGGTVKQWQKPGADGKYPAPPLNGTAHAWHHDIKNLKATIDRGGVPLGGTMPAFKNKLSDEQKTAVIAYIQSLWPEEIYQAWKQRNG